MFSRVTSVCAAIAAQLNKADIKTGATFWLGEGCSELFHVFGEV